RDEAAPEMMLPKPVNNDASRQRMIGCYHPLGQRQAPPGMGWVNRAQSRLERAAAAHVSQENFRGPGLDGLAFVFDVATPQDPGLRPRGTIFAHGHRLSGRLGGMAFDLENLPLETLPLSVVGRV